MGNPQTLVLKQVVKSFAGRPVVDRVSLEIGRGEFFSLLGPSGAGKTTLLRLCAGFDSPDSGSIQIDGRPMVGVPPQERPVNTVFQSYALFPHLTVEDNVGFGLDMRRVAKPERNHRVGEALALLNMGDLRHRAPGQLSGGEQQRVAIARAVVNRPALILLDEPMAALDEPLRQAMLVELKSIQRRLGTTFLCVTHHQEEALAVSDRVAVMRDGRISQIGRPQDIYESPASRFVADFVGRSNFLTGTVVRTRGERHALAVDGMTAPVWLPAQAQQSIKVGDRATLLVRAECVRLTDTPPMGDGWNAITAHIDAVRFGGAIWHYTLRLPDQPTWHATTTNDGTMDKVYPEGAHVVVSWLAAQSVVLAEPVA